MKHRLRTKKEIHKSHKLHSKKTTNRQIKLIKTKKSECKVKVRLWDVVENWIKQNSKKRLL